ncbi:MAG TPA: PVC-type heme-binding CxxCH protein [Urbifossiella sp.]|nr:PVC-type heme-binding CxxCH protein [Urbifossiella sp.]
MRIAASLAALLVAAGSPLAAADPKPSDRPVPAAEASKAMTVPPGFAATLFAGEPDVVQPIAMTFDTRGRLWVVECLSYPNWRKDGKGSDRVTILEDADGDGKFDKRTVFLNDGVNLSGIEIGFGGVWLCSSPNLLFIPDRDGDDKPDGPPQVILDGWNIKDTKHNVYNSLGWGPDGWLYGCNGIQAKARVGKPGTPDKERTPLDCGVWRYHPIQKRFELYASGTTNPWGLDWDDFGQMFITNCVIHHIWNVIPGGHMERMYGDDVNPYTYGLQKSCADHLHWGGGAWTSSRSTGVNGSPQHSEAGGGHAHSGCAVYLGDNFPPEYRNSVFMCNIHGNRLNRDWLDRTPRGYIAKHSPDFLFANDSWFRGIVVKCGPDGGLYVSDWSDTGECHNYDRVDLTNGRIFRVVHGTAKPWRGDVAKLSDAELLKLQFHTNDWFTRQARCVLQERAAAGKIAKEIIPEARKLMTMADSVNTKLRLVWTLHILGGLTDDDLTTLLGNDDENIRLWAAMLGSEPAQPSRDFVQQLLKMTAKEDSQFVMFFLAGMVQRLPVKDALALVEAVAARVLPGDDPNLALAVWYAVQSVLARDPKAKFDSILEVSRHPLIPRNTARYLVARSAGTERSNALAALIEYAKEAGITEKQRPVLAGMQEALAGLREFPEPRGWKELYAELQGSRDDDVRTRAEALAVLFGNEKAIAALLERTSDASVNSAARIAAIELLARRKLPALAPVLHKLLTDPAVRGAAVRALAAYPDANTPAKMLAAYPQFTASEKTDAVQTLASRAAWANAMLDAVEQGKLPRAEVSLLAARQIIALNDKKLTERLGRVWGKIQPASKERVALIKKWKGLLKPESMKAASAKQGRALFTKHCGACHKLFGEGGEVGPDLTGSQRANLDYLLENVLDPSAVVPREFQVANFTLADGRLVSGIVLKETPDGLSVRTANETVTIVKGDIEQRKQTNQSIMPDGLFDALKPEEVRDLMAYLRSPRVPD